MSLVIFAFHKYYFERFRSPTQEMYRLLKLNNISVQDFINKGEEMFKTYEKFMILYNKTKMLAGTQDIDAIDKYKYYYYELALLKICLEKVDF